MPKLVDAIKRGVMLSGALPMEFPTISIHESFAHPTSMFLRNLMAMDTEEMLRAQPMDSVVLIGGCDKTIPARIGIPTALPGLSLRRQPWSMGDFVLNAPEKWQGIAIRALLGSHDRLQKVGLRAPGTSGPPASESGSSSSCPYHAMR